MDWKVLYITDETEVHDCRFALPQAPHFHYLYALENADDPNPEKEQRFIENACLEAIKEVKPKKLKDKSVELEKLTNPFSRETIREVNRGERLIIDGRYENYADGLANYVVKLDWTGGDVEVLGDSDDYTILWPIQNGRKATAVHSVYGSLTPRIPESKRDGGRSAYFNSRICDSDPKLAESNPELTRAVIAQIKLIYGVKKFREH